MVLIPGQLELEDRNFSSKTDHNQLQELSVVASLEIAIDQWLPWLYVVPLCGLQKLEESSFNLSVTNNNAERGIRIITDFLNKTKDKNLRQALLQTVEYFR